MFPQHDPALQPAAVQGGCLHVPPSHSGLSAGHRVPQPPQFVGSFCGFTQRLPQQIR
jgi:hypothetical protein